MSTSQKRTKKPVTLESIAKQIRGLATKKEVAAIRSQMATKDDLKAVRAEMATKDDLRAVRAEMATKDDLESLAIMTKTGFDEVGTRLDTLEQSQYKLEDGQAKLEQGQEEIKFQLAERAAQFDVQNLDRRVTVLEGLHFGSARSRKC